MKATLALLKVMKRPLGYSVYWLLSATDQIVVLHHYVTDEAKPGIWLHARAIQLPVLL